MELFKLHYEETKGCNVIICESPCEIHDYNKVFDQELPIRSRIEGYIHFESIVNQFNTIGHPLTYSEQYVLWNLIANIPRLRLFRPTETQLDVLRKMIPGFDTPYNRFYNQIEIILRKKYLELKNNIIFEKKYVPVVLYGNRKRKQKRRVGPPPMPTSAPSAR